MTNSLIKNTSFVLTPGAKAVPGTPYVPAQPARTVYETRRVCGFRYAGAGHYVYNTDLSTGQTTATWVPDSITSGGTQVGGYQCWEATVPVFYPATPAIPATPGSPATPESVLQNFYLGWNAGGRSLDFFTGNGAVTFQARQSVVAALVGMRIEDGAPIEYTGKSIDYAFLLSNGVARVVEKGVTKFYVGPYTDNTEFTITRTAGAVVYNVSGDDVYTSSVESTAAGWLQAALYAGGDEVLNPAVFQQSAPDLTAGTGDLAITLPRFALLAADRPYGGMALTLPRLEFSGEVGLPIPAYALLSIELPPLAFSGSGLTGEIGSLALALAPLQMRMADHPYGELAVVLPPLEFAGGADAAGFVFTSSAFGFDVPMTGANHSRIDARDAFFFDVAMDGEGGQRVDARDSFIFDVAMSAVGAHQVDARDAFRFDVAMSAPGADLEVHAVNLDGYGSTSYSNFGFNSFARIGDRYYGAKLDGLFLLGGPDDDGAEIDASFCPGKLDFGNSQEKTISEVFAGAASEQALLMRVALPRGTFDYQAQSYSAELQQHRFKLGKGLKANYLTPVFYNQDGADFELDSLEFSVADLSRKTQS